MGGGQQQQQQAWSGGGGKSEESLSAAAARWRGLVDALLVELVASLFVCIITLMCWTASTTDPQQYMPSVALGLVLLVIKDEDYFFPDVLGPTVTVVLWVLGGYSWSQLVARITGQVSGAALALWICLCAHHLPALHYKDEHALTVVFALEAFGTALEQLAVVYVVMPLLPPAGYHHQQQPQAPPSPPDDALLPPPPTPPWAAPPAEQQQHKHPFLIRLPKILPKSHSQATAPSNPEVMHAALSLAGLHWCLTRGLCIEMNPPLTVLVAILRQRQPDYADKAGYVWSHAAVALWGQCVGTIACVVFVAMFAPRRTKFWPSLLSGPQPPPPPPPPLSMAAAAMMMPHPPQHAAASFISRRTAGAAGGGAGWYV
jgi:glycerol uptake facilitator-like aquaporin